MYPVEARGARHDSPAEPRLPASLPTRVRTRLGLSQAPTSEGAGRSEDEEKMLPPRQERRSQSKGKGLRANRRKKAKQRARCSNTSMSQPAGGMGVFRLLEVSSQL